jgi:hypothetical protein
LKVFAEQFAKFAKKFRVSAAVKAVGTKVDALSCDLETRRHAANCRGLVN